MLEPGHGEVELPHGATPDFGARYVDRVHRDGRVPHSFHDGLEREVAHRDAVGVSRYGQAWATGFKNRLSAEQACLWSWCAQRCL